MPRSQTEIELDSDRFAKDFDTIALVRDEVDARLKKLGVSRDEFFGGTIRRAIDEVLSFSKSRWDIDQLDATEKTYVGTRVEILIRDGLDLGRGKRADVRIAGQDVDIKWSKSLNWMIGPENLGTVCLGIGTQGQGIFSVGIYIPRLGLIRTGVNRDKKYSLSSEFKSKRVEWLVQQAKLQPNFFASLEPRVREEIMSQTSAQLRVNKLGELLPRTPIPRSAIAFAASGKDDPMRRARKDKYRRGSASDQMVWLSAKYKDDILKKLGIEPKANHFYCVSESELRKVRNKTAAVRGNDVQA